MPSSWQIGEVKGVVGDDDAAVALGAARTGSRGSCMRRSETRDGRLGLDLLEGVLKLVEVLEIRLAEGEALGECEGEGE